ncbi:type II secretion system GspH family protein [Shimazuella sp. AN120528]|nr:type II secretion system GspH family protein [Shimazuella soli]
MFKREKGFTLVETLVALMVGTTLIGFVVPLYITGKMFFHDRMLENKARIVAQELLEERLSRLQVRNKTWKMSTYTIQEEVTYSQPLWDLKIFVKWKNHQGLSRMVKLETRRFQN